MRYDCVHIGHVMIIAILMVPSNVMGTEHNVFQPLSGEALNAFKIIEKKELAEDKTLIRMVGRFLNDDVFMKNAIEPSLNGQPIRPVILKLFDDLPKMSLIADEVRLAKPDSFEWIGHVEGDPDSIVLFVLKQRRGRIRSMLAGTILNEGRLFRIGSNDEGLHFIYEIDRSKIPPESSPARKSRGAKADIERVRPVRLELPDHLPELRIVTDRVESLHPQYLLWHGHLEGEPKSSSTIIITEEHFPEDHVTIVGGFVSTGRRVYRIGKDWPVPIPLPPDIPSPPFFHLDPRRIVPGKEIHSLPRYRLQLACQVDVLVGYSIEAKAAASDIDEEIRLAFLSAQTALDMSRINLKLRRVGEAEVRAAFVAGELSYHEAMDIEDNLIAVMGAGGPLSKLHQIRDTVGADLVSLWIATGRDINAGKLSCGMTYPREDFSIVARKNSCIDNRSFVHELAHSMGAYHDRTSENNPSSLERWYGYIPFSRAWGTIMAVEPCAGCRKFIFSNPDIDIDGEPAGIPGPADNAADNHWHLNSVRGTVAARWDPKPAPGSCAVLDLMPPASPLGLRVQ